MQEQDNLVLIILSGMPCAGKSTWSKRMTEYLYLKYNCAPVIIISRDTIRLAKYGKKYDYSKAKEAEVTKEFYKQMGVASTFKKAVIILDNTHCRESGIDKYLTIFRGMHSSKKMSIYVKFLDIPLWKANLRNIWRRVKTGKWVPFKVMKEKYQSYNKINKDKYKHLISNDF